MSIFSATGGLLPGSYQRPDFVIVTNADFGRAEYYYLPCKLNQLGYIPLVSTITGLIRTLLGIIHTIVHLVSAIFDRENRISHLKESILGAKNIVRGIIETTPILGNLAMFIVDTIRKKKCMALHNPPLFSNNELFILHAYGEQIAQKSAEEIIQARTILNREPSESEMVNIIASPKWIGYF